MTKSVYTKIDYEGGYIQVEDCGMLFQFQQHEAWEAYRKERK